MAGWQILLIGIASLAVGLSLGSGVHFLLKWLARRREMILTAKKQEMAESAIEEPVVEKPVVKEPAIAEKVVEEPVVREPAAAEKVIQEPVVEEPVVREPAAAEKVIQEPVVEEPVVKEPAAAEKVVQEPVVEEPVVKEPAIKKPVAAEPDKAAALELLGEIESNLEIANKPWAGKLLPFQTRVWETIQDSVDRVPANIHDEVRQIYIDIRLANSIVRLATDFNRRSKSLDDSYKQLCISIAEKLSNIKPLIEKPGR